MKPLIVANWKCNPTTLKEAKFLFEKVKGGIKDVKGVEVVICPPFVYLSQFFEQYHRLVRGTVRLGTQDCFWENSGPFTGEVSPTMLKDLGCQYVILGHSARRIYLNETDEMVNRKLKAILKVGLKPILCIGSIKKEERGDKEMKIQLTKALVGIKKSEIKNIIITYEPIWAITTTKESVVATPDNSKNGKIFIREILSKLFDKVSTQKVRIIYGGSVNSQNIEGFIQDAQMDGVLVGAASLEANEFIKIVKNSVN